MSGIPSDMSDATRDSRAFWTYPFDDDEEYQVRSSLSRARPSLKARKQGLSSIAQSGALVGKTQEELNEVLLRSRVFFLNRYVDPSVICCPPGRVKLTLCRKLGFSLTLEEVLASIPPPVAEEDAPPLSSSANLKTESDPSERESSGAEDRAQLNETVHDEPPPLTFAQLKELIEQGRLDEIPNNKVIPDGLNVSDAVSYAAF
jgi:hypothetical protein